MEINTLLSSFDREVLTLINTYFPESYSFDLKNEDNSKIKNSLQKLESLDYILILSKLSYKNSEIWDVLITNLGQIELIQ
ncbi:MAG: hypothetical protein QNJ32_03470 [Xenococcaceae cyanobacterium MO_167.B27]|nr:hypothetical protein [Xenococcaceae cyanobacterium MO_167.B27]